jgi:hypothetical protein
MGSGNSGYGIASTRTSVVARSSRFQVGSLLVSDLTRDPSCYFIRGTSDIPKIPFFREVTPD